MKQFIANLLGIDWPIDWRERMAQGDKQALKHLNQYFKSPEDVYAALRRLNAEFTRKTQELAQLKKAA